MPHVLLLGRLQRAGRQTPMVQESRHANVVRVRDSTRLFWLAGTDCGLHELCGSWIFLSQGDAKRQRTPEPACKGPITVFPGQGYMHSRYALSLDLFLGQGEANGLVEDEEAIKLEKGGGGIGARLTYTKVPGVTRSLLLSSSPVLFSMAWYCIRMLRISIASARRFIS
jgi:hypothetical protein